MSITRENILSKTNYGLNIYAYVLRQFHPGEVVLKLSGRECLWVRNPFTKSDKPGLRIRQVENVFLFEDEENPDFKGDPFDFASHYFNLTGENLLKKIDECLFLDLEKKRSFYSNNKGFIKSKEPVTAELLKPIVDIPLFSFYQKPVKNTIPAKSVNLREVYELIKADRYKKITLELRDLTNKTEARIYKAQNFDYVTFSGVFKKREDKSLIKHSGYIVIDFDHVSEPESLKVKLLNDEFFETELLYVSPSGDGLKWVISIDISQYSHSEYFEGLQGYILQTYNLQIDKSGSDVSRACFLCHDSNVFINSKHL